MNGMIAPLTTGTDGSNCPLKIGDAAHRMAHSPDGASLIQATRTIPKEIDDVVRRMNEIRDIIGRQ